MLYQLNYIHHLWDCKDSVFPMNYPNIFHKALVKGLVYIAVNRTTAEWPFASMTVRVCGPASGTTRSLCSP